MKKLTLAIVCFLFLASENLFSQKNSLESLLPDVINLTSLDGGGKDNSKKTFIEKGGGNVIIDVINDITNNDGFINIKYLIKYKKLGLVITKVSKNYGIVFNSPNILQDNGASLNAFSSSHIFSGTYIFTFYTINDSWSHTFTFP